LPHPGGWRCGLCGTHGSLPGSPGNPDPAQTVGAARTQAVSRCVVAGKNHWRRPYLRTSGPQFRTVKSMTQSFYEFFCPVKLISGVAALEHVPYELSVRSASKPLIITDKGVRGAGLVDIALEAFAGGDLKVGAIYDDVPPDSSLDVVRRAAQLYRDKGCDSIIAIGGGSVIDTSKG